MQDMQQSTALKTGKMQCSISAANAVTVELRKGAPAQPSLTGSTLFPSVVEVTLPDRISYQPVDAATAAEEIARCLNGSEPKSSGLLRVKSAL